MSLSDSKSKFFTLIFIFNLIASSCSNEKVDPITEPTIKIETHVDSLLVGYWRHYGDRSFGFQIEANGQIWFMRTNIETGIFSRVYSTHDSIVAENGKITIFDSVLCTSQVDKSYYFLEDTLVIPSFFESRGKYVKTHENAQFIKPLPNHFEATITDYASKFQFESSMYSFNSNYTLNNGDFWFVAEMTDIQCMTGPAVKNTQLRYFYFYIPYFSGVGTYILTSSSSIMQYGESLIEGVAYSLTYDPNGSVQFSGIVEITKYDKVTGLVEGTVNATLKEFNGSRILKVENGFFSYYGPWYEYGPDYN